MPRSNQPRKYGPARITTNRYPTFPCNCRQPRKLAFHDEITAKMALAEIQAKDSQFKAKNQKKVYQCPLGNYHLTSWSSRWEI